MKTFYLMRHGKSDWSDPSLADFERPLADRGRKDARAVGKFLASLNEIPDLIVTSSAERARRTAEIAAERIGLPENRIRMDPSLYEASAEDLVRSLMSLDDDVEAPLVIGHNPALEHAAAVLLTGAKTEGRSVSSIRIPTAGVLCYECEANDWRSIETGACVLRWMIIPKIIK